MASVFAAFKKTTIATFDAVVGIANASTELVRAGSIAASDLAGYVENVADKNATRRELSAEAELIADISSHEAEIAQTMAKTMDALNANPSAMGIYDKISTPEATIRAKYQARLEAKKRS